MYEFLFVDEVVDLYVPSPDPEAIRPFACLTEAWQIGRDLYGDSLLSVSAYE